MFGKVNKKETIIAGNCIIESGLNTTGNIKIYGKINGSIKVDGDVIIGETGGFLFKAIVNGLTSNGYQVETLEFPTQHFMFL